MNSGTRLPSRSDRCVGRGEESFRCTTGPMLICALPYLDVQGATCDAIGDVWDRERPEIGRPGICHVAWSKSRSAPL